MKKDPWLKKLAAGEVVFGLNNMYPSPGIVEVMCPGWDFVWIDMQHGQHQYDSALAAVRAADLLGIASLVRSPGHEPGILGPICDMMATMVMVPLVDTPEQARAIVRATQFPPLGNRSYGGRRPIDRHGRDYWERGGVGVVAQIESPEAVDAAAAIAAVEGIDGLFFGPDDMKLRLGLPMDTTGDAPELVQYMRRTAEAAKAAGKFCGCAVATRSAVSKAIEMGYQLIAAGSEVRFIREVAPGQLAMLREVAGGAGTPAAAGATAPAKGGGVY